MISKWFLFVANYYSYCQWPANFNKSLAYNSVKRAIFGYLRRMQELHPDYLDALYDQLWSYVCFLIFRKMSNANLLAVPFHSWRCQWLSIDLTLCPGLTWFMALEISLALSQLGKCRTFCLFASWLESTSLSCVCVRSRARERCILIFRFLLFVDLLLPLSCRWTSHTPRLPDLYVSLADFRFAQILAGCFGMLEGYHNTAISALIMKTMGADCAGAIIGMSPNWMKMKSNDF